MAYGEHCFITDCMKGIEVLQGITGTLNLSSQERCF